jgi:type II secretory pathway pseudopilin PulG
MRRRRRNDDGFVLVEALAALGITALTAAALLAAVGAARDRSAEAAARDAALRQARDLIVSSESVPWTAIGAEGAYTDSRLRWSRQATVHPDYPNVIIVTVAVDWAAGRKGGTTRLETYRYARS